MYKNLGSKIKFYWKTIEHTLNVILGFIPRIHIKHYSLDTRDRLFVTPEYDWKWSLIKGLDVVCQCAALLERRVQSSTRVRKVQAVTRQTNPIGRSMIEMLGVLAIIGVLSVGGITGYSKAMEKIKINKTLDEISTIIANTQTLYAQQKAVSGIRISGTAEVSYYGGKYSGFCNQTALAADIVPPEMIKNNKIINAFNGEVILSTAVIPSGDYFSLAFKNLSRNACIALATYDWGQAIDGISAIAINDISRFYFNSLDACSAGTKGEMYYACKGYLPISVTTAATYCKDNTHSPFGFLIVVK